MLTYYFIPIKLLGHLLWVAKKVAEKENLNESGYRIGKNTDLFKFVKYSGTFHLGHLHSGYTIFGPGTEKCWYKLCIYYMAGSMSGKDEANPVF